MGRNDGKKAEKVLKILQGKEKKYQSEYSENAKASENASRAGKVTCIAALLLNYR